MAETQSTKSTKGNFVKQVVTFVSNNKVLIITVIALVVVCIYLYQRSCRLKKYRDLVVNGYAPEGQPQSQPPLEHAYQQSPQHPQEPAYQQMSPQQKAAFQAMMIPQHHEEPSDTENEEDVTPQQSPPEKKPEPSKEHEEVSETNSRVICVKDIENTLDDKLSTLREELSASEAEEPHTVEVYKRGPKKGQPKPKKTRRT